MPIGQLGPGERDNGNRLVARPVEQVVDEVEETCVGPVDVLEHEHDGALLGEPLEEQAPGGKEVVAIRFAAHRQAEQLLEPGLHPFALRRVGDVLGHRLPQLRERLRLVLVLGDAGAHPHHLGERPEGDALAVREAAAPMPVHVVREAVDVLLELPGEP